MVAVLSYDQMLAEQLDAVDDFMSFVRQAWPILEPSKPFVPGWHLDALAEHLTAVYRGEIKRLLVNMPPRHAKSNFINVLWPAWVWLNDPSVKFLCASYAMNLATRDNLRHRRLIKSAWWKARYGRMFALTKDQDAKTKFENDRSGSRMAVSVGSSTTGEGFDIGILDDPHNIDEKESDAKRDAAIDWFANTWSSRPNDQQKSAMVVVGQRIHMNDVSGHILENNIDGEWVHLNLPSEYDPATPCRTYFPSGKERWRDPRMEEGELLWESRFPRPVIEKAKKTHGALDYAAIHGQNPIPRGGHVFNVSNERLFTITPERDFYILLTPGGKQAVPVVACKELVTSDVAPKDKEINDFTVFAYWAITPQNDVLLLDVKRDHWTVPKQKEQAKLAYYTWFSQRFQALYFEDVGYQSAIGQDLLVEGIPCLPFTPRGDKVLRAGGASIWQEAGKVYFLQGAEWLEDWKKEIYTFPRAKHDDQVDTLSMVCMIVRAPELAPLDHETANSISNYRGY